MSDKTTIDWDNIPHDDGWRWATKSIPTPSIERTGAPSADEVVAYYTRLIEVIPIESATRMTEMWLEGQLRLLSLLPPSPVFTTNYAGMTDQQRAEIERRIDQELRHQALRTRL